MTEPAPDTILAHPALAGRTVLVRRGRVWAAHLIQAEGRLGEPRILDTDPAQHVWRAGRAA
ncbi:MAG TPA: hypothetical protein VG692_02845 [Gemmatimonadales bacterium]|nr:hypothetical protein [Gemmatimonadales bacterium]